MAYYMLNALHNFYKSNYVITFKINILMTF